MREIKPEEEKKIIENINQVLQKVPKDKFLIITRTWHSMMVKSYEDHKVSIMWGIMEKHLPDFLTWLSEEDNFKKVKDVALHEFVNTMKVISYLGEESLNGLINTLEAKNG